MRDSECGIPLLSLLVSSKRRPRRILPYPLNPNRNSEHHAWILNGLDVVLDMVEVLFRDFGDDEYRPVQLLTEMVEAGDLGRRTGKGIFEYKA